MKQSINRPGLSRAVDALFHYKIFTYFYIITTAFFFVIRAVQGY